MKAMRIVNIVLAFVATLITLAWALPALAQTTVEQSNADGTALEAIVIFIFSIGFYFLPAILAKSNHKRQTGAIFALNFFLGWTVLGWIGAFVWAVCKDQAPVQYVVAKQ